MSSLRLYADRIEEAVGNPVALEQLRGEVNDAAALSDEDKRFLDGRIGTYLADRERADEPEGGYTEPDAAPEEVG